MPKRAFGFYLQRVPIGDSALAAEDHCRDKIGALPAASMVTATVCGDHTHRPSGALRRVLGVYCRDWTRIPGSPHERIEAHVPGDLGTGSVEISPRTELQRVWRQR